VNTGKCPKCDFDLPAGAKFCAECGAPVDEIFRNDKERKSHKGISTKGRDWGIITALLIVLSGAYMVFSEPRIAPEKPAVNDFSHGSMEMEGMAANMTDLPEDYDNLVITGNNKMDHGNYAVAAECYRRALEIKSDVPDVRVDFGACLHGIGLSERAVEEFMIVIKDYPNHPVSNFNLGVVYFDLNQMDSARFYWEKYLSINDQGAMADAARKHLEQLKSSGG